MKTINHCFIIIALLSIIACNKSPDKKFNIKITKTESGYFYDIYKKNKIIIHQPNIPAVIGDQQFKDSTQCKKIAQLVVKKLEHKIFPTITIEELKANNVQFRY